MVNVHSVGKKIHVGCQSLKVLGQYMAKRAKGLEKINLKVIERKTNWNILVKPELNQFLAMSL